MLGERIAARMRVFAGDCVPRKKPAPDIYNLAARVRCLVGEGEGQEGGRGARCGVPMPLPRSAA
jgi:hypothetical protein